MRRLRVVSSISCLILITLVLATPSARAYDLSSVRVRIDGTEMTLKTHALFDGKEVYLPIPVVERLAGWASVSPRGDTVLMNAPGQRIEIALARPGAEPMAPASLVARALRYTVKNSPGYCDLFSSGYTPKPIKPVEKRAPVPEPPKIDPARSSVPGLQPSVDEKVLGSAAAYAANAALARTNDVEPGDKRPSNRAATNTSSQKTAIQAPPVGTKIQLVSRLDYAGKAPSVGAAKQPSTGTGQGITLVQRPDDMDPANLKGTTKQATQAVRKGPPEEHQITIDLARQEVALPPAVVGARITDVKFIGMDSTHAQVRVSTTATVKAEAELDMERSQLAISMPGAMLDPILTSFSADHPFISTIAARPAPGNAGSQVILNLKKLVSYQVLTVSPTEVLVNIGLPRGSGRRIQDTTIIIDPGHGAEALGGYWKTGDGCVYEKDLTLAIARKVRDSLIAMGCRVIMSRESDANPSLKERPAMVAQNNADLFLSIHINDCKNPNTASGSETFFHAEDASSRAMAQSVLARMLQVSGLPSRGAKSDLKRFPGSGMAVLRYSPVPSTLVEVGFINHAKDRAKMMSASFQKDIAVAIAAGVRGYVEAKLPDPSTSAADSEGLDIHVD